MNRFLCLLATMLVLNSSGQSSEQSANIVFIFIDDMSILGETLGGDPQVDLPNMQRLVDRGVKFENAHANSTICGPSRASLISGLYPSSTGYYGYRMGQNSWLDNQVIMSNVDMYQHMLNSGYGVYGSGKVYHDTPLLQNFTEYFNAGITKGPYAWDGVTLLPSGDPLPMSHPEIPTSMAESVELFMPLDNVPTLGSYTGWINLDGTPFMYVNDSERDPLHDERVVNWGTSLLNTLSTEEPFFLTFGIHKPHTDLVVPQKYFDLYPLESLELTSYLDSDLSDVPVASINNRWNSAGNVQNFKVLMDASVDSTDTSYWLRRYQQAYYASVSFVDDLVGQILDSLDASPHADNTYVILTSDHGFKLGEKTLLNKTTLWDRVTRVPLIISGPGVMEGAICQRPVSLIDVYPTVAEMANTEVPSHIDGNSLMPLLADPTADWFGPIGAISTVASDESIPLLVPLDRRHQHYSISTGTHRYMLYATGEEELYDMVNDRAEWYNLAADDAYADVKSTLRQALVATIDLDEELYLTDLNESLYHGSFEQNLNGWVVLGVGATQQNQFVSLLGDAFSAPHGQKFIRAGNPDALLRILNRNIIMNEGSYYKLTFKARRFSGSGDLTIRMLTGLTTLTNFASNSFQISGNEWNEYEWFFQCNAPTTRFSGTMELRLPQGSGFDLDDFRLIEVGEPFSANNLLRKEAWFNPIVYPNPASGRSMGFTLPHLENSSKDLNVRVLSQKGQTMYEGTYRSTDRYQEVALPQMASGLYMVEFKIEDAIAVRKLIIP